MTHEQRLKAFRLKQAVESLRQAKRHITVALGDSDVTQWYGIDLAQMIEELEEDVSLIVEAEPV
jgi:hypothetical protein